MEKQKSRGITVIALAITVIVLLILSGVIINSVIGSGGILSNTAKTKKENVIAEEKNILKLSTVSAIEKDNMGMITESNLNEALKKNLENYELTEKDDANYGKTYEVKFTESGNIYTVLEDGTILTKEDLEDNKKLPKLLQKTNIVLEVGERKTIELTNNDNIENAEWKNYNDTIVEIENNETNSKKIDIVGKSVGTAIIEVTVEIKNGDKTTTSTEQCTVTVKQKYDGYVEKIILDKTECEIDLSSEEKTIQLNATVEPENVKANLEWSSSDPTVAKVDENGLVTGIKNGNAIINVTIKGSDKSAQCRVSVVTNPKEIILDKTELTLDLTEHPNENIIATVLPEIAMNAEITWNTSDSSRVKISSNENIVTVTGLKNTDNNTPVEITASTKNGKKAVCKITVVTSPSSITVSPANISLDTGDQSTYKLIATIHPDTANTNTGITWSSNNTSVATVNEKTGEVTLKKYGDVIITAKTSNGRTGQSIMKINTKIRKIELEPKNINVGINKQKTITAKITPSDNNDNIKWISSDTSIATVDQNGVVTGVGKGKTTITAQNADGTAKDTITVISGKSQYGWYVKNYTAKSDSSAKWKLLYEDENNVYLISDTYINVKNLPIVKKRRIVWNRKSYISN